jgi:sulfite reductase (ferredoxin)
VPKDKIEEARASAASLSLNSKPRGHKIVACAGASTCKLGLCLSPALAQAIEEKMVNLEFPPAFSEIHLSGCPNNCANHSLAALGFEGTARRKDGRLMPCYNVLVGGHVAEGTAHLGERLGVLPARIIPDFLADVLKQGLTTIPAIQPLVEKYAQLPSPIPANYFVDWGQETLFTLAGRGPGECGAGVLDIVRADLDESTDCLTRAQTATKTSSLDLRGAILASARALLPLFGVEARNDRDLAALVTQHLVAPGWVSPDANSLIATAFALSPDNQLPLQDLMGRATEFHDRVLALHASLDSTLHFQLKPLVKPTPPIAQSTGRVADLRGVCCPMNFVKAKVALNAVPIGEILQILLDQGEPANNVPASFADQGQEVVSMAPVDEYFRLEIRRTQ